MHIPSGASQTIEILSFDDALAASGRRGDYDSEKWLYVPDFYTEYRYILGTKGRNPLICIGINPSTAAPDDLDNTLKSVARIAAGNGFDSWTMFNVYAQRATRPKDMDTRRNDALHRENMAAFAWALRQGHVSRFRACDRQAYAGRDKRAIVVMHVLPVRRVSNGLRAIIFACGIQVFDALQSRSHARLRLVEQIFRI